MIDTTTTGIIGSLSICIYGNTVLNHAWYTCVVNAAVNVSPFQKSHLYLSGIAHVCVYVAMQLPVATFSEFSNIHRQQHYYGCVGIKFAMRGGNSIKLSRSGYPTETGFLDPGYLRKRVCQKVDRSTF